MTNYIRKSINNFYEQSLKISFYQYIFFFYVFVTIPIFFIFFFSHIFIITSNILFKEALFPVSLFFMFSIFNKFKLGKFSPLFAIIEIILPLNAILYLTNRAFGLENNHKYPESIFKMGLTISLLLLLLMSIVSSISLIYKPLFLEVAHNNILSGFILPAKIPDNYSFFIIYHNLLFIFFIYISSFLIYLPVYGTNYINSAIIIPVFIGSFYTDNFNYILPNGILEISGILIASGTAFVLMFYIYEMIRLGKNFSLKFTKNKETIQLITMGILISTINFLIAWPMEVAIIKSSLSGLNLPFLWFKYAYFLDVSVIISEIISFIILFKTKYISPATLFTLFLPLSVFGFIMDINPTKINSDIYLPFVWGFLIIFSLLLIINYFKAVFFKSRIENKNNNMEIISGRGNSMFPLIKPNDFIIIDKADKNISVGDIIAYETRPMFNPLVISGLITHRVIKIDENYITTKGDNVARPDIPIKKSQITGKVVAVIHHISKNKVVCESFDMERSAEINQFFMLNQFNNNSIFSYKLRVIIFSFVSILINLFIIFI